MNVDPASPDAPDENFTHRAADAANGTPPALHGQTTETLAHSPTRIPKRIGRYHVKGVIASGGMGTVYEAVQEQPHRTVALKLMKHGIASRSALRRFEYESQILARLRHPGIAQVYEAGTHRDESGTTPYFAMEYIVGAKSITKYAKEKKLTTRQKLELLESVCDAVHHGHQKGIIHRDLKPSNILVDASGRAKIIDFGVARSTDSDLAVTTLQTDIGQLIGTLQYMSPEQCEADPHNIDTRSDVYALGVLFYELLCGKLPYDVTRVAMHEATRIIREQQPTKLSTLNKTLRGDVETIALKALEKDRERRYQSATDFAQDIRRYLNNVAIAARPASMMYQFRVLVRRNKPIFAAIAAVFVVLVGATIVSTTLYVSAKANRMKAESEAAKAQTTLDFLAGMYDAGKRGRGSATLRTSLEEAERKVESGVFALQPEIEATVRHTIGRAYFTLDQYDAAAPNLEIALAIRRRIFGDEHLSTMEARSSWADLLQRRRQYRQAESHDRDIFLFLSRTLGPEHPTTLLAANRLAYNLSHQNKHEEAEALIRPTLERARRVLGPDHTTTRELMSRLARLLTHHSGKYDKAERMYRELLLVERRTFGEDDPETLWTLNEFGNCLNGQDKLVEAQRVYEQGVDIAVRHLGDRRRVTIYLLGSLGNTYRRQGRLDEAAQLCRQAWEAGREVFGDYDGTTLADLNCLVKTTVAKGKLDEARVYGTELLRNRRHAAEQPDATERTLNGYARFLLTCVLEDLRDPQAALPVAKRAVEMSGGEDAGILDTLALAYFMTGDTAKSIETQEEAVALLPPGESSNRTKLEANLARYRAAASEENGVNKPHMKTGGDTP